jgi:hypothetical protein
MALLPVMYFFGRAIGMPFVTSLVSGGILAFLPNVWLFGEGGFSDVPSAILGVLACALLFSPRHYLAGAIVLGIAAGMRPQNLLIGLFPALIGTFHQLKEHRYLRVAAAALIGAVILVAAYGGAAAASGGWENYSGVVRAHEQYIRTVDSFRNPNRPSLARLFDDFFFWPFRAFKINVAISVLSAIALLAAVVRRNRSIALALLTFVPFAISAWLLLDHFSASRFSIAYMPLFAILAAEGIRVIGWRAEGLLGAALVVLLAVWTFPAIDQVRRSPSPPMQAMQWIRSRLDKSSAVLYVHGSMQPYTDYYLTDYNCVPSDAPPISGRSQDAWYVTEGISSLGAGNLFAWEHGRLWSIARQRYFEVSIAAVTSLATFVDGWYDEEGQGTTVWRWMGAESRTFLPEIAGNARLRLRFFVPLDIMEGHPTITILLNGTELDRFTASEPFNEKTYTVGNATAKPNVLVIRTSQAVSPAAIGRGGDGRTLGLRLEAIDWTHVKEPSRRSR